jgi:hypothetical protein
MRSQAGTRTIDDEARSANTLVWRYIVEHRIRFKGNFNRHQARHK